MLWRRLPISCICPCCLCVTLLLEVAVELVKAPLHVMTWFTSKIPCWYLDPFVHYSILPPQLASSLPSTVLVITIRQIHHPAVVDSSALVCVVHRLLAFVYSYIIGWFVWFVLILWWILRLISRDLVTLTLWSTSNATVLECCGNLCLLSISAVPGLASDYSLNAKFKISKLLNVCGTNIKSR